MPVVTDPLGVQWSVYRELWPFPNPLGLLDNFDLVGAVVGLALAVPFLILWPFWLLAKVRGVRWVVVVQRNDKEVRRERVRGRRRSGGWMTEIALELSQGWQSGHDAI